jgi:hypothetical protein
MIGDMVRGGVVVGAGVGPVTLKSLLGCAVPYRRNHTRMPRTQTPKDLFIAWFAAVVSFRFAGACEGPPYTVVQLRIV